MNVPRLVAAVKEYFDKGIGGSMSKRYVQHKSDKQGEKFLLSGQGWNDADHTSFEVIRETRSGFKEFYYLPKSEYVLCALSDKWDDITKECEVSLTCGVFSGVECLYFKLYAPSCYDKNKIRVSKVDNRGFIVEHLL